MPQTGDHVLAGLCRLWIEKINRAHEYKKSAFQDDADECQRFYRPPDGNYNFVYRGDLNASRGVSLDVSEPQFKMTLNKTAEVVQIFGPLLYHQNPNRQVNPRAAFEPPPWAFPDPSLLMSVMQKEQKKRQVDQLKSDLLSSYVNWTPNELGLAGNSQSAIDEALIKGMGLLWTATITPPGSKIKMIGSFYDSVDMLLMDPDAENRKDAWWIARKVCQPVWEVERRFGLEPGSLKGRYESVGMAIETDQSKRELHRQRGLTNDLLVYYEIYSRMGCGGRLSGSDRGRGYSGLLPGDLDGYATTLDPITGDYVYLVVAEGIEYPLNLPPDVQETPITGDGSPQDGATIIKERLAWPIPFWADNRWPVSELAFHEVPRSIWPMSHLKPALGELRFLCWAYSFVACKIKNTLRDIVAILKEMSAQFKITTMEGADLSLVELDTNNRDIRECIQIMQFPQMNADIWRIIDAVERNFDKRVGLNEVFYGQSTKQDRSATESDLKSQTMNIRPDDMAKKVEAWMTEVARKEACAARLLLKSSDVLPVLGVTASALWELYVTSDDLAVFHELEYRIEANSTRKPNRDRDMANADSAMQILLPILNGFAQGTGQLGPVNALIGYWCKTRDLDPGPFLLPSPPPPQPGLPPPGPGEPPGAPPGPAPAANGHPASASSRAEGGPPRAPTAGSTR